MQLNVPKEQALKILRKRLGEIDSFDFEPSSWKKKTQNDIKEIFNDLQKSLQVGFINFDTPITSSKHKVLEERKKEARELVKSYIESIEEYVSESGKNFSKKVIDDLKISMLKSTNSKLSQENERLKAELSLKKKQALNDQTTIDRLTKNTVQLNNISLLKLFKLMANLPAIQIVGFIGTIVAILVASFKVGEIYQETSFQNEKFELNRKYENAEKERIVLADSLNSIRSKKTVEKNLLERKASVIIFNSNNKAISIKFQNISNNHDPVKSRGISIPPNSFGRIDLEKFNHQYEVRRFIDYKKNSLTENKIYMDSILRINNGDNLKTINIQ